MRLGIRRTGRGFTLVELLTVAGVIVVLATLVMSAVFAAQEAGRNATCRNNLSQIHKLMLAYTPNYGGYMPSFWHERWVGEMGLAGGRWREGITELKKDPRYAEELWQKELDILIELDQKAELEAFSKFGLTYIVDEYLPAKLGM